MARFKTRKFEALGVPRRVAKQWKKEANSMVDQLPGQVANPASSTQPAASPPSPARIRNGAGSSRPTRAGRTYGNPPASQLASGERTVMLGADPELQSIYMQQVSSGERMLADDEPTVPSRRVAKKAAKKLVAAGVDPDEVAVMLSDGTDPELLQLWMSGLISQRRAEIAEQGQREDDQRRMKARPPSAPLGMDDDRYTLHVQARQLAQTRCDANQRLDPGKTYCLAAIEIAAAKFAGPI
jgi:hypothetical protein